jgi:hypothetical protein
VRAWEKYYADYPDNNVTDVLRRWGRNRALFEKTGGLAIGRDVEFALRAATDRAGARLEEADDVWTAAGCPLRGRAYRRWDKRRMEFFKAVWTENREYEGTLIFRGLDPHDDTAIEAFIEAYREDD